MPARESEPRFINQVYTVDSGTMPPFATTNPEKLKEFSRILGYEVQGAKIGDVDEPQSLDPLEVIRKKAIWAHRIYGGPVYVEDSSFGIAAWDGRPGTYVKDFIRSNDDLIDLCEKAKKKDDYRATARVMIGIYDGRDEKLPDSVHVWEGVKDGTVADKPRGNTGFDWDAIFIPNGQETLPIWDGIKRTYGELMDIDPAYKDALSMRTKAFEALRADPFILGTYVRELPEPYKFQVDAIDETLFNSEQTRTYAYDMDMLGGMTHETFSAEFLPGYYEIDMGQGFKQYVLRVGQAGMGLVVTPMDLATDLHSEPYRLKVEYDGRPVFWQPGVDAIKMAVAARAWEFETFHNEEMYDMLRTMMSGEIQTGQRSNKRSVAIENLIGTMKKTYEKTKGEVGIKEADEHVEEAFDSDWEAEYEASEAAAFKQLAYARRFSPEGKMSRTESANRGLFSTASGIPSSIFGLGGMPPVTSSPDVLATAALSYMDCYITHNSIYAGYPERQIALFLEAKEKVQKLGLPKDIEELVIAHIGISVGSENPEEITRTVQMFLDAGGSLVRVYTTNTDYRVPETAKLIRREMNETVERQGLHGGFGEKKMRICVGPIVDVAQAERLNEDDILVNILLIGHGGGENCTSLEGGGAANAMELAYILSLMKKFNRLALGLEGGTGTSIGALLGFVDLISLNRRGVAAGMETGGLYMEHTNGRVCVPYHGTASPVTQWIEAIANPALAGKRVDSAGRLRNVEGKPNYMFKPRAINSIVDAFHVARMLAGRALADQQSRSIDELRQRIELVGYENLLGVSSDAYDTANHHRGH
jgi:XTP/dITP diphosphohydrolase